jgi:TonB family protein
MSETPRHTTEPTPVGHLSVHIEGDHPQDVPFMFERVGKRMFGAMGTSIAIQGAITLVLVFMAMHYTAGTPADTIRTVIPPGIVWIAREGPGGGGGGGGNRSKEPPRKLELPGKDAMSVPAAKPKPLEIPKEVKPSDAPPQIAQLDARALQQGALALPGTFDGVPGGTSQGPGSGGGAGSGTGSGIGPGNGSGIGPGWGGGTGGGPYRPGNGIQNPEKIREVKPAYTAEAMRAKIQGTVIVECVVLPDGTVGDVQVVKSLDPTFGLDQEAVKAAKQWRFIPGRRNGQPVAVLITIELTFTLR